MPTETEELPSPEVQDEEQEGGPVKPFLEHLEDLRWVLIKSLVAASLAIIICLLAGDRVVNFLRRPLDHATVKFPPKVRVVDLDIGTNRVGRFQLDPASPVGMAFGTNPYIKLQLKPVALGGQEVYVWSPVTNSSHLPTQKLDIPIINLGPTSAFFVAFKVAIYAGIGIASPFIFYYFATFIFPALKIREKKYIYRGLGFALGLFFAGVSFCYFILAPIALTASVQYSEWLGFGVTQWRAEEYISFICMFMLGMGLGFELPVVVLTLVKIGLVSYSTLVKARRYVLVINFVLGAMLTTPEVITQVLMAVPLQILYEISVWIAWYWERQDKKAKALEELKETAAS